MQNGENEEARRMPQVYRTLFFILPSDFCLSPYPIIPSAASRRSSATSAVVARSVISQLTAMPARAITNMATKTQISAEATA